MLPPFRSRRRSPLSTRLGIACERVIEAGWLGALVVTPLLFNVHSSNVFDVDKTAALRAIALLILLAWALRQLEAWLVPNGRLDTTTRGLGSVPPTAVARRWALLGLIVLGTQSLATVTSIAPHLSLWGSIHRHQGLLTTGAYFVVFLALLRFLRTREQAERLVTTALLASLPVSLYGILQHFGVDPIPWTANAPGRVASTMGNPIFAAAFLIMAVPLTLYRHLESGMEVGERELQGTRTVLVVGSVATVLLQVAAWRLGPMTGCLTALTTLGIWCAEGLLLGRPLAPFLRVGVYSVLLSTQLACLLLSQSRGPWFGLAAGLGFFGILWTVSRARWRWTAAILVSGVVVALAIGWINVAESRFPGLHQVPYVGRLTRLPETSGGVRLLIWDTATRLMASDPSRALVGYGPETMGLAVLPHVPPVLGQIGQRGATVDRAHNDTLDVLVTTGLVGVAARLLLLAVLFTWVLRCLGLLRTWHNRHWFPGYFLGGGLAAAVLAGALDQSWRVAGAAVIPGALVATVAYVCTRRFRGDGSHRVSQRDASLDLLTIALLSAIVAHLVEIQFGFGVTATRTYFWTFVAVVVLAPLFRRRRRAPSEDPSLTTGPIVAASVLASLVLVTLLYTFLTASIPTASLPFLMWMFGITWGLGGLLWVSENRLAASTRRSLFQVCGIYIAVTLLSTAALVAVVVYPGVHRLGVDVASTPLPYYAHVLVALLATAAALVMGERLPASTVAIPSALAAPLLIAAAFVLMRVSSVDVVRADIYYKQALVGMTREPASAAALARHAVTLGPPREVYQRALGQALLRQAVQTDQTQDDDLWRQAEASFVAAGQLSPRDPENAGSLARLYEAWAEHTSDSRLKTERARRAIWWYSEAAARSPSNVLLWNELGAAHVRGKDYERAFQTYQRSSALDDRFVDTHLHIGDLHLLRGEWDAAEQAYRQALARNPDSVHGQTFQSLTARLADSVRHHERVLESDPHNLASLRALAALSHAAGDVDRALAYAGQALAIAPAGDRPGIERLITFLRRRLPPGSDGGEGKRP